MTKILLKNTDEYLPKIDVSYNRLALMEQKMLNRDWYIEVTEL